MIETDGPVVDVAMVTYNHARFFRQAIESVLAQVAPFEIRITVGDDCSTDGTQEIIREYVTRYPQQVRAILYDRHEGILTPKRVVAPVLRACTAPYLAVLDGDDYWVDTSKLLKQVAQLHQSPELSVSCHHFRLLDESKRPELMDVQLRRTATFDLDCLLEDGPIFHTATALYKNCLKGDLPSWFFKIPFGDFLFNVLHAQLGNIGVINEVMSVYRVHPEGLWNRESGIRKSRMLLEAYGLLDRELSLGRRAAFRRGVARQYIRLARLCRQGGRRLEGCRAALRALSLTDGSVRAEAVVELWSQLPWTPRIGLGRWLARQ